MNVIKLLQSKIIGVKSIDSDGNIIFETEELTEQDIEELSHLRVNVVNGVLFDDRERSLKNI